MDAREKRITKFFEKEIKHLKGQSLIVCLKKVKRKYYMVQRDGAVEDFQDGLFLVRLGTECIGFISSEEQEFFEKEEEIISMNIPQFFESYDLYIDWICQNSSLPDQAKNRIRAEAKKLHHDYRIAYNGKELEIRNRTMRAWEYPHVLNIGTTKIKNAYI